MTCRVAVSRSGTPGVFDPDTGSTAAGTRTSVVECSARVQARFTSDDTTAAGQRVTLRGYLVSLPWDVPEIRVGDLVEVIVVGPDDDPELLGTALTVRDVIVASTQWQRDLACDVDLG